MSLFHCLLFSDTILSLTHWFGVFITFVYWHSRILLLLIECSEWLCKIRNLWLTSALLGQMPETKSDLEQATHVHKRQASIYKIMTISFKTALGRLNSININEKSHKALSDLAQVSIVFSPAHVDVTLCWPFSNHLGRNHCLICAAIWMQCPQSWQQQNHLSASDNCQTNHQRPSLQGRCPGKIVFISSRITNEIRERAKIVNCWLLQEQPSLCLD